MNPSIIEKMRPILDDFVTWQTEDGCISKERCPYFAPGYRPLFRYMEIPFMGRTLYRFYDITKEPRYKTAADKYMRFYMELICDLIPKERIAYKFGMALEAAALYAKNNPLEAQATATYVRLFLKWLRQLKDPSLGSYFRCGYLPGVPGIEGATDVGFSDDLCHVGRGLTRAYELLGEEEILSDLKNLSRYFLTDQKDGTQDGIWNPSLGTWAIGPWPDNNFEHMQDTFANRAGWVYSAYGDVEFLMDASVYYGDGALSEEIALRSKRSIRWIFENCFFEDGAVGMTGLDDKWLGLTAAAILGVVNLYRHHVLSQEELNWFRPYVQASWNFLLAYSGESMPEAGYMEVTGNTNPIPGDNVAWLLSWVAECLAQEETVAQILRG